MNAWTFNGNWSYSTAVTSSGGGALTLTLAFTLETEETKNEKILNAVVFDE